MTTRRSWLMGIGSVALAGSLAGCASAPTRYYRLAAVPGPIEPGVTAHISVRSISIPSYLNADGIAKPGGAYQYTSFPNALWASPLADLLQSVMVQDLAQRLPQAVVIGAGGAIGVPADRIVEINVLRFDPAASGELTLIAQASVRSPDAGAAGLTRSIRLSAPCSAVPADIAAVMSKLWGQAADVLAQAVAEQR
ncbi:MAG: hypothetical protein B7Z80_01785 [Rhodospirillales bacterium 20-64-7]|nr:MAG: hypothetical protein B7Z80_01785 [Rhodospirillales bacterium 20-64-7]